MSTNDMTKAMQRVVSLVDEGSFVEIGSRITLRSTDFTLQSQKAPGDGVVTGYATIGDKLVFIYSQDAAVLGGSMGEMHAKKITSLYDKAMKMGAPVIGLIDCAGLRLEEVSDALNGFGMLYASQAKASGMVPQISAVFGKCGGGMAIAAGLSDFVLMEEKSGRLYVNAPNTIDGNFTAKCDTASAAFQAKETGLVDFTGAEEDILSKIRDLVDFLPSNNEEAAVSDTTDDLNRLTEEIEGVEDAKAIAEALADDGTFLETKKDYAPSMITGFVKMDGITTGIVANAEKKLTADGLEKAAAFVNFCDAFEIPVLTLTNTNGYEASMAAEKKMAMAASKLVYAYANATVPKINVIIGEAYGSAYLAMSPKALGADIVFAAENAKVGMMDASMAAKVISKDGADLSDLTAKFEEKQTADAAASRGYVDEIVSMSTLRKDVLAALEMLFNKRDDAPVKKHGAK